MPSLLPHDLCHGRSSSRAPSSDRIPVELFQILKDDAVESAALNMQYAICTQYAICRLTAVGESGHRTRKGQCLPQSQRRAVLKNVQTTGQLCSFPMLVRSSSKSFKL